LPVAEINEKGAFRRFLVGGRTCFQETGLVGQQHGETCFPETGLEPVESFSFAIFFFFSK
jgi:hypothetical protein